MTFRVKITSAEFKEIDGEGRWVFFYFSLLSYQFYTIHLYQNKDKIRTVLKRYSEIRGLHTNLEKANTLLGGFSLPEFPSWVRLNAGYTSIFMMRITT